MSATLIYEAGFGLINIGLLAGIFFRLGGMGAAHKEFDRRLGRVEQNQTEILKGK